MKKIIGIFVMTLFIATAVLPAVGIMNEKEKLTNNRGGIFIQLPKLLDSRHYVSGVDEGWICYEDFLDITTPICDIHWWGITTFDDGVSIVDCDPTGMTFDITFYEDDNGYPGDVVCQYTDIILDSITPTGIIFESSSGFLWEIRYFEYNLDPCCELFEGWVSILKKDSPNNCMFGWTNSKDGNKRFLQFSEEINDWVDRPFQDLSLVLTDGEPAIPDLESDRSLSWTDVPAGKTVTSSFNVANNGDATSILHWKIESYPDWGVNWTFTPSILTPEMGEVTVDVEVVAPEEKNEEFTGEIKIVNVKDPEDFCIISVSLTTPKNKANIDIPFIRFLHQHPNMFPLLRYLLSL